MSTFVLSDENDRRSIVNLSTKIDKALQEMKKGNLNLGLFTQRGYKEVKIKRKQELDPTIPRYHVKKEQGNVTFRAVHDPNLNETAMPPEILAIGKNLRVNDEAYLRVGPNGLLYDGGTLNPLMIRLLKLTPSEGDISINDLSKTVYQAIDNGTFAVQIGAVVVASSFLKKVLDYYTGTIEHQLQADDPFEIVIKNSKKQQDEEEDSDAFASLEIEDIEKEFDDGDQPDEDDE